MALYHREEAPFPPLQAGDPQLDRLTSPTLPRSAADARRPSPVSTRSPSMIEPGYLPFEELVSSRNGRLSSDTPPN